MLLDKLEFIENKYDELSVKISDPSIMQNQNEWRKLCKEHADLEIIVKEDYLDNNSNKDYISLLKLRLNQIEEQIVKIVEKN